MWSLKIIFISEIWFPRFWKTINDFGELTLILVFSQSSQFHFRSLLICTQKNHISRVLIMVNSLHPKSWLRSLRILSGNKHLKLASRFCTFQSYSTFRTLRVKWTTKIRFKLYIRERVLQFKIVNIIYIWVSKSSFPWAGPKARTYIST